MEVFPISLKNGVVAMIAKKKRPIPTKRQSNIKYPRKLFLIATEGTKTEPDYFKNLKKIVNNASINIKPLTSNSRTAPGALLKRITKYLEEYEITNQDEAWIVMDRDQWNEDHIIKVIDWTTQNKHYGLALTNPKFEYWLLLHFEDGNGVQTARECNERIKQHIVSYHKNIPINKITLDNTKAAIDRLRKKEVLDNKALLNQVGSSIDILVERILKHPRI